MINKKNITIALTTITVILAALLVNHFYTKIYKSNVVKDGFVYIPSGSEFPDVKNLVHPFLKNTSAFNWVAKKKKYTNRIKAGKYELKDGMSTNDLVNLLRSGNQTPVKIAFNNQDSFEKLAGRIAQQIEADSLELLRVFNDERFIAEHKFNSATALSMYIPNSYEFYWNTNAQEFRSKMLKEYHKFWNDSRLKKVKKLNLTPVEVSTIASIVQKETAHVPERKTVAGLYLNRYKNKWPLQADPTIIFAIKQQKGFDTEIKRVFLKDLEINSAYNTYKNLGLPPGPIGMPDISSIDAVLNPANHDYYYMCASVTDMGKHVFAKNLAQHNVNARKYQNWVAKQGY